MGRIEDLESIVGFSIKDFYSKRGQKQVIEDHMIERKHMKQYCILKSLRKLEPDDNKREKISLYFLHNKYPHNIIISSLCDMSKYPIKTDEERKNFNATLKRFEDMYDVPSLNSSLIKELIGCIEEYRNGDIPFDEFSKFSTTLVQKAEELYSEALKNFEKSYVACFREEDIKVISGDEEESEL